MNLFALLTLGQNNCTLGEALYVDYEELSGLLGKGTVGHYVMSWCPAQVLADPEVKVLTYNFRERARKLRDNLFQVKGRDTDHRVRASVVNQQFILTLN